MTATTFRTRMSHSPVKHPLARKTRIVTVRGEIDHDHDGEERITPPGTIGRITGIAHERENGDPGYCYDLEYANGTWITRDDFELDDPTAYRVLD
jgi:hypothetical protein